MESKRNKHQWEQKQQTSNSQISKTLFFKKKKPELTVWSRQPYGSVFVIPRDNIQNPGQYR